MSSAAQQVLCACISAVMRSPNACYASAYQLVGDELLDISSVYVYERAVTAWILTRSIRQITLKLNDEKYNSLIFFPKSLVISGNSCNFAKSNIKHYIYE